MKITKTSIEVNIERNKYKEAHDGCEKCPCCNEADVLAKEKEIESDISKHIPMKYYMNDSIVSIGRTLYELRSDGTLGDSISGNKFIKQLPSEEYTKRGVHYRIDKYRCRICGAEWESDPYEVNLDPNGNTTGLIKQTSNSLGDGMPFVWFAASFLVLGMLFLSICSLFSY